MNKKKTEYTDSIFLKKYHKLMGLLKLLNIVRLTIGRKQSQHSCEL